MDLQLPTLCPEERQRRRLSWRNETNLYKRKSDLSATEMISIFSEDKPYTVYSSEEWFGDKWDAMDYGQAFDFKRTFSDQFAELHLKVPKLSLIVLGDNINSDFTHDAYRLKNCYFTFDGEQAVDCLYGETFVLIKNSLDFLYLTSSELCYECVNCSDCYNLSFSSFCHNCSNSAFLQDCTGCKDCFGCSNLKQKQYYIANKPYSREDYERITKTFNLKSHASLENLKAGSLEFFRSQPKRAMRGLMNENCTGDNLNNCKDTFDSYDCRDTRDCSYCTNVQLSAQDCHDIDIWGDKLQRSYDSACVGAGCENIIASHCCAFDSSNIFHSSFCWKNTHDAIGCEALVQKRYCILNKQYSKEEYETLAPKVIAHMRKTGEWGEFFPTKLSSFAYNETVANDYFPMRKEEALARDYQWKDPDPKEYQKQSSNIPDNIDDVPDEILDQILACINCGRNYKIQSSELHFYRRQGFPIPRKCFHCRHLDRAKLRNPRHLYPRDCQKCGIEVASSYSEERPEIIYCEKCYLLVKD